VIVADAKRYPDEPEARRRLARRRHARGIPVVDRVARLATPDSSDIFAPSN
jgi:hypothetical protein